MVILKRLAVGPIGANCYIVGSESSKEGMIIDPGDEAEKILKTVRSLGLKIKIIVLTHRHWDHIGAAEEVRKETGAELAIHPDDARYLKQGSVFGTPFKGTPDRLLKEGENIEIGESRFSVIHTPGHSSGGISLFGQGVVFTGDTLFNYGIGRYDLQDSSYAQLMNSLNIKLMALPDETIVYPGHGPESTIGDERRGNPFLHERS